LKLSASILQPQTRALVMPRELDDQPTVTLEIACIHGQQQLLVSISSDLMRDTFAIRYRINDQPQKQTAFARYEPNMLSIRDPLPREINFAKRLRLELMRSARPALLLNFDVAGANGIVNAIRC
jgi:hypothetical protein